MQAEHGFSERRKNANTGDVIGSRRRPGSSSRCAYTDDIANVNLDRSRYVMWLLDFDQSRHRFTREITRRTPVDHHQTSMRPRPQRSQLARGCSANNRRPDNQPCTPPDNRYPRIITASHPPIPASIHCRQPDHQAHCLALGKPAR